MIAMYIISRFCSCRSKNSTLRVKGADSDIGVTVECKDVVVLVNDAGTVKEVVERDVEDTIELSI